MLCAPNNRWRPFLYHTKMADFEYFRVFFSVFTGKIIPSHNHTRTLCFIPPLFPFSCPTYTPFTFSTRTITVFTPQFNPFPSQAHTIPYLLPPSPHSNQPPIPYINRTGIPLPVMKSCKTTASLVNIMKENFIKFLSPPVSLKLLLVLPGNIMKVTFIKIFGPPVSEKFL